MVHMQQTLTAPPVRSASTIPLVRDSATRPSLRDRLQARRARNAAMTQQILAMPATRGVGGVVLR